MSGRNLVWTTTIVATVLSLTSIPAFAVTWLTNDSFFDYGDDVESENGAVYWGDKADNAYTGTLGKVFYCQNASSNTKQACINGLIDGRTNFVRFAVKEPANDADSSPNYEYQVSMQGEDPFGWTDNVEGGATNHNINFPRSPIAPAGTSYKLNAQFAWFTSSPYYSESKPSSTATNGAVNAQLVTDVWFKDKITGTNSKMVIDFSWAFLENYNGQWRLKPGVDPGEQYGTPFRQDLDPTSAADCVYHYNVVLDNFSVPNGWRQPPLTTISGYIANAFSATYANFGQAGNCPSTIYGASNYVANYNMVDIESGIEVFTSTASSSNYGTLVGAYSFSNLRY